MRHEDARVRAGLVTAVREFRKIIEGLPAVLEAIERELAAQAPSLEPVDPASASKGDPESPASS